MILQDILQSGAAQFEKANLYFGHGTDNAWDEAVWIALHVLGVPLDADQSLLTRALTSEEVKKIQALYDRRAKEKIPTAYLLQEAWFGGLPFFVDERVLIPRSPMAELIQKKFKPYLQTEPSAILDLCTGSGCIAILCAKTFPKAQVDAIDISKEALEVARINVKQHQLDARLHLIQSDLLAAVQPAQQYDVMISNPPYVDGPDMNALPQEYRHEPELALAAGQDGLILVDKILKTAVRYLKPDGILIVEVGNSHVALKKKYPKLPFKWVKFKQGDGEVFFLSAGVLDKNIR